MENGFHRPVLLQEAARYLLTRDDGIYVDCTLGGGGHSEYFLQKTSPAAFLIGIDADAEALQHAEKRLKSYPNKAFRCSFFDQADLLLLELDRVPVDGFFFDLGISSHQVNEPRRGFTFQAASPLDMRFSNTQELSAAEILNKYPQPELERVIRDYGEERHWRAIVREIIQRRAIAPLQESGDLVDAVKRVIGERFLNKSLARVFQALRIEVNAELTRLPVALQKSFSLLRRGGRIVVISYHSLEDRIVKNFFKEKFADCVCPPELPQCSCDKVREVEILTRRPVVPSAEEIAQNPRARSARLRAAEKVTEYVQGSL